MGKLYVSKVNLISNVAERLYNDDNGFYRLCNKIISYMGSEIVYNKEYYKRMNGLKFLYTIKYTMILLDKTSDVIKGRLIRESQISYKTLDPRTRKMKVHNPETAEEVTFYYDVLAERIAFNITSRFRHRMFIEGMSGIINQAMINNDEDLVFELSLCKVGLNIETLRNELSNIQGITELIFDYQLPNPDSKKLKRIQENKGKYITDMELSRIDNMQSIFRSKKGVNINSPLIDESIDTINNVHNTLSDRNVLGNGYVKVKAKNMEGVVYSSEEDHIFTREIDEDRDYFEFCRETIYYIKRME